MKNHLPKIATLLALLCVAAFAQKKGTFKDPSDGRIYKTVKIDEQTWLAENLTGKDGECYDDKPANCKKYGGLYDWQTAMEACPEGWHLPNNEEWESLIGLAGGTENAGKKLKAKSGWNKDHDGKSGNGTDIYGFSALPGGICSQGDCNGIGSKGYWWSASNGLYYFNLLTNETARNYNDESDKTDLLSVRCVQD